MSGRTRRNVGAAPTRRREGDVMSAYDRLPPELRAWLAQAALPWSPRSALRAWRGALARSGCTRAAAARLSAIEAGQLARQAGRPGLGMGARPWAAARAGALPSAR